MIENKGMGLAANQVGIEQRVFIMDNEERYYFNPKIVKESDELCMDKEGCLSFPEVWLKVERPKTIEVMYETTQGKTRFTKLQDLESKCFQHEFDHIEGITFNKRVSKIRWQMANKG